MSSAQTTTSRARVLVLGLLLVSAFLTLVSIDPRFGALFGLLLVIVAIGMSLVSLSDVASAPTSSIALLRDRLAGFGSSGDERRRRL